MKDQTYILNMNRGEVKYLYYDSLVYNVKKIGFLLFFHIILCFNTNAQVIPKGMNYQAVARNSNGGIIPNQQISLKIFLFATQDGQRINYYAETHEAITNDLGLFNLIIGEGEVNLGEFGLFPWNKENIWLEVTLGEKGRANFSILSSSKLMAVPYAMHSLTTEIVDIPREATPPYTALNAPGVISSKWSVFGNANTNQSGNLYHTNSLGTTDKVDLIMITDNVERLRILAGGDIVTKLNFEIGKNLNVLGDASIQQTLTVGDSLTVKKNVLLNTMGGSTFNYGSFTVSNSSPTLLSGTLTVDLTTLLNSSLDVHGPTDLNNRLYVNNKSPTHLTGTLQVDKSTNLQDSLNVNNMSPTHLSGTLTVDKHTMLNDSLTVSLMAPSLLTGTLVVDKSTVLTDTLNVNNMSPTQLSGTLTVQKESVFNDQVLMSDTTQSNSVSSGALVVNGGMGVGRNLNVGGSAAFGGPVGFASPVQILDATESIDTSTGALIVSGGFGIGKNLNIGGMSEVGRMVSITDTTESTNTVTGALKVVGGTGIGKNINVGGATAIAGVTSITSNIQSNNVSSGALKVSGGVGINKELNVGGMAKLWNAQQSNDTLTGALRVTGGMGIGNELNVGGMTTLLDQSQSNNTISGALKVSGGTGIGLQLNVGGMTSILNTIQSTSPTSGALKVTGGLGILKNLNVGDSLHVYGLATLYDSLILNKSLNVTSSGSYVAQFTNTTNANGISIQINNPSPHWDHNYVEFRNNVGGVVGRIEGESASQEVVVLGIPIIPGQFTQNPKYQLELERLNDRIGMAALNIAIATVTGVIAGALLVAAINSYTVCVGFPVNCVAAPIASLIIYAGLNAAGAALDLVANAVALGFAIDDKNTFVDYKRAHVGVTYESGTGDYAEWIPKSNLDETFLPGYIVGLKNGQISKIIDKGSRPLVISSKPIILGNVPQESELMKFEKVAFLGQVPTHVLGKVAVGDYILSSGNDDGLGIAVSPSKLKVEDYERIVGVAWSSSQNEAHNMINVAIGLNGNVISTAAVEQKNKIEALKDKFNKRNEILSRLLPKYKEAADKLNMDDFNNSQLDQAMAAQPDLSGNDFNSEVLNFSGLQFSQILDQAEKVVVSNGGNIGENSIWHRIRTEPEFKEMFMVKVKSQIKAELPKQLAKFKSQTNAK